MFSNLAEILQLKEIKKVAKLIKKQRLGATMCPPEGLEDMYVFPKINKICLKYRNLHSFPELKKGYKYFMSI